MVHMVSAGGGQGGLRYDNPQDFDPLGGEVGSFDFLMIKQFLEYRMAPQWIITMASAHLKTFKYKWDGETD